MSDRLIFCSIAEHQAPLVRLSLRLAIPSPGQSHQRFPQKVPGVSLEALSELWSQSRLASGYLPKLIRGSAQRDHAIRSW